MPSTPELVRMAIESDTEAEAQMARDAAAAAQLAAHRARRAAAAAAPAPAAPAPAAPATPAPAVPVTATPHHLVAPLNAQVHQNPIPPHNMGGGWGGVVGSLVRGLLVLGAIALVLWIGWKVFDRIVPGSSVPAASPAATTSAAGIPAAPRPVAGPAPSVRPGETIPRSLTPAEAEALALKDGNRYQFLVDAGIAGSARGHEIPPAKYGRLSGAVDGFVDRGAEQLYAFTEGGLFVLIPRRQS